MKLAVIGSRGFNNYPLMEDHLSKYNPTHIVSGGAQGADKLAELYAVRHGIETIVYKPDWTVGRHAGFLRNIQIVDSADCIIAFWDGKSKGTKHTIDYANKKRIPVNVVIF